MGYKCVSQDPCEESCQRYKLVIFRRGFRSGSPAGLCAASPPLPRPALITFKVDFVEMDEMGLTTSTARDRMLANVIREIMIDMKRCPGAPKR